jgi:hypothetical protein
MPLPCAALAARVVTIGVPTMPAAITVAMISQITPRMASSDGLVRRVEWLVPTLGFIVDNPLPEALERH